MQLKNSFTIILISFTCCSIWAQTKGIIIDKITHLPIPYVSIYAQNGDQVLGAMSDEQGRFKLKFPFQTLFFSHINYSKIAIAKIDLKDTIYMMPREVSLGEVIVSNRQSLWVQRILKKFVQHKAKNYQPFSQQLMYEYETYVLSDFNGYAFKSKGDLMTPDVKAKQNYNIRPLESIIRYKDRSAGCDFSNLKRILYDDDFIKDFDNSFINDNLFFENSAFENNNPNLVQLRFKSKQKSEDSGFIVIDTLTYLLSEIECKLGTESNVKKYTSFIYRNFAASFGFKYNEWQTLIYKKYSLEKGHNVLSEARLKSYLKSTDKRNKSHSDYFSSTEARLTLLPKDNPVSGKWILLTKPIYIGIFTKEMRIAEEELKKIPVKFEKF